ncbi:hypothetical protein OAX95_00935 [bacterium]|nr:hypothetical protein [bacterium]
MGHRTVGAIVMGAGALCLVLGLLLTFTDDGGDSSSPAIDEVATTTTISPEPSTTTSTLPPTTTPPTTVPTTTLPAGATEQATSFFATWQQANRTGDIDLLLALLHPLVFERYGVEQCRTYLPTVTDEQVTIDVREATLDPSRRYETDGQTATPADAYAVQITSSCPADAVEFTATLAFVDGELRWFTDCGDPV